MPLVYHIFPRLPSLSLKKVAKIGENLAFYIDFCKKVCYYICCKFIIWRVSIMKHIQTIETRNLCESAKNGGCGECQTSCQSACKTSCGIANQQCENTEK